MNNERMIIIISGMDARKIKREKKASIVEEKTDGTEGIRLAITRRYP
jgi:hypothetical protein